MLDLINYRARIGTFCQKCKFFVKNRLKDCERRQICISGSQLRGILLVLIILSLQFVSNMNFRDERTTNYLKIKSDFADILGSFRMEVDNNFYARYTYGNKKENGIHLIHWNKGSSMLPNKMSEIQAVVQQHKPHVLGFSEANLFPHHDLASVTLPNYKIHKCPTIDNPDLQVSRVVVYTHDSLIVKPRNDLMDRRISAIWLEIGLPHKRKFLLCNFYREWGYMNQPNKLSHSRKAQLDRWKIFLDSWEKALDEDKEVIVQGDININSLKWTNLDPPASDNINRQRPLIDLLFEKIISRGVVQLVRVATHNDSCLDHFYTNKASKISEVSAVVHGGSDHKLTHAVRYTKDVVRCARYVRRRCFKNFDQVSFMEEIRQISWFDVYMLTDVDQAVSLLISKIQKVLDKYAPVKSIQIRSNYAPWLSETTKLAMQKRNVAQLLAKIYKDEENKRNYRNLRNNVTSMLRSDKRSWEQSQLDHAINKDRNIWKNVKGILQWRNGGPPNQIFSEGKLERSPKKIAAEMNNFFIGKVKMLQRKLPEPVGDPLQCLRNLMAGSTAQFQLNPVFPDEVLKVVKGLKSTKSTGLDNIDVQIVKMILIYILPALTHVINLSLSAAKFPAEWKKAKVIPLLKKGDPLCPSNYRPVALLPILSKVLEKVVFKQVLEYVEQNGILHPSHHGSRPHHSTSTAVIEMYSSWVDAIEAGEMAGVVMLDLSAAFDLVDHDLLLQKLCLMGFSEGTLAWFKSYLGNRQQCVQIDGHVSDFLHVSTGVPQGSVLGALLYILFVNELPEVIHDHLNERDEDQSWSPQAINSHCNKCGHLCCYVDDSTFTFSSKDPEVLSLKLSEKYQALATFLGDNRLVINKDKTHLIVMGSRKHRNLRNEVIVNTGETIVNPEESEKLLGLIIDQTLGWKVHIRDGATSLLTNLNRKLGALRRVSLNATFKTRLLVANACFQSVLSYMITVWGGADSYLLKALQVIQNKAARTITKQSWFTPTRTLLKQCNWLSVRQLIFLHTAMQMWKILNYRRPANIFERFQLSRTRSNEYGTLAIPNSITNIGKQSFLVRAATTWNHIPMEIRISTSITIFRKKLKPWILNNIDIN